MADKKPDIHIYKLKIVIDKASKEVLHLSEYMENEGNATLNIDGEDLVVPEELADMLSDLEGNTLGIT
tara:strand:- start:424 stop:627 length:204 start_codon:yes stop_codon:yes gene_type:complete